MTTHAATDAPEEAALAAARATSADIVTCDACPVLCRIRPGKTGACDRYGNVDGHLARMDPLVVIDHHGTPTLTAIGAGTTYPDYKPAPFIVGHRIDGIDMITVVSEGVFSYCGLKVKIDTDQIEDAADVFGTQVAQGVFDASTTLAFAASGGMAGNDEDFE